MTWFAHLIGSSASPTGPRQSCNWAKTQLVAPYFLTMTLKPPLWKKRNNGTMDKASQSQFTSFHEFPFPHQNAVTIAQTDSASARRGSAAEMDYIFKKAFMGSETMGKLLRKPEKSEERSEQHHVVGSAVPNTGGGERREAKMPFETRTSRSHEKEIEDQRAPCGEASATEEVANDEYLRDGKPTAETAYGQLEEKARATEPRPWQRSYWDVTAEESELDTLQSTPSGRSSLAWDREPGVTNVQRPPPKPPARGEQVFSQDPGWTCGDQAIPFFDEDASTYVGTPLSTITEQREEEEAAESSPPDLAVAYGAETRRAASDERVHTASSSISLPRESLQPTEQETSSAKSAAQARFDSEDSPQRTALDKGKCPEVAVRRVSHR